MTILQTPKVFLFQSLYRDNQVVAMKTDDVKAAISALNELNESYVEVADAMNGISDQTKRAKKLSRGGNKSRLIKIGLALIVFPEPTPISETVGACFVAVGAVQQRIKSRSLYIEDITKTLQKTLKEVRMFKDSVKI
jgi:hypothetical protein